MIPVTVGDTDAHVSFRNDELCTRVQEPPYRLTEYDRLYSLVTKQRSHPPIPEGKPTGYDWKSMPLHATIERLQAAANSRLGPRSCNAMCGTAQVDCDE